MKIALDSNTSAYTIRSYAQGEIKIKDKIITQNLVVTPTRLIYPWDPQDLSCILDLKPDIVLLGRETPAAMETLAFFLEQHIGIESMNIGAACRTFNVLASEERNVALALWVNAS